MKKEDVNDGCQSLDSCSADDNACSDTFEDENDGDSQTNESVASVPNIDNLNSSDQLIACTSDSGSRKGPTTCSDAIDNYRSKAENIEGSHVNPMRKTPVANILPIQNIDELSHDKRLYMCSLHDCASTNTTTALYPLPEDKNLALKWASILRLHHLEQHLHRTGISPFNFLVCEKHFEDHFFVNVSNARKQLSTSAVPTENISHRHHTDPPSERNEPSPPSIPGKSYFMGVDKINDDQSNS